MKLRFSALGQKRIVFFLSSGDLWGLARDDAKKKDHKTILLHTSSFVQQKASFLLWGKNGLNDFRLAIFGDDSGDDKKRIWL